MTIFYKTFCYSCVNINVGDRMKKEVRTVCYDEELRIEALSFEGVSQPFPNHFHEHYVIGLILRGRRDMLCNNRPYALAAGDAVLLGPADSHGCVQADGGAFDYIALNIAERVMRDIAAELTGEDAAPRFSENAVPHSADTELCLLIKNLHALISAGCGEFEKDEAMLLLMSHILERYGKPFLQTVAPTDREVERVCAYISEHCAEHVTLDELCREGRMSRSALLRSFTRFKGITPYRYLQSVRINRAKALLEQGTPPAEAAALTGFSDQSHFTNAFHSFFGSTPAAYGKIFAK